MHSHAAKLVLRGIMLVTGLSLTACSVSPSQDSRSRSPEEIAKDLDADVLLPEEEIGQDAENTEIPQEEIDGIAKDIPADQPPASDPMDEDKMEDKPSQPAPSYGQKMVDVAKKYLGKPYVFGASTSSTKEFDCSSLVWRAVYATGLGKLPRTARAQQDKLQDMVKAKKAIEVPFVIKDLKPGDILHWHSTDRLPKGVPTHTGMYYGDGKFIHAIKPKVTIYKLEGSWMKKGKALTAFRILKPI